MELPYKTRLAIFEFGAEFLGAFIILFFGCGCGGSWQIGMITGSWQAGIVWGLAVAAAIFASAPVSGAHLNPAITLGMASTGKLPLWKVPHFLAAQLLGAFSGASIIYSFFWPTITIFEEEKNIIRGETGSFLSGSMFRCTLNERIGSIQGFYIEWFITTMLLIVVCYLNDKDATDHGYGPFFPPMMIGLTVAILTAAFAPLTSACLNPVRDLGPRLLTLIAGWGRSAFPGETRDPWWPFIFGPIAGGVTGCLFWEFVGSKMYQFASQERKASRDLSGDLTGMGSTIYEPSYAEVGKEV